MKIKGAFDAADVLDKIIAGKSRIKIVMTTSEAVAELSEGNPGALTAMTRLFEINATSAALAVNYLDFMEIYGPNIWLGFKDVCGRDPETFLRAVIDGSIKQKIAALPYFGGWDK